MPACPAGPEEETARAEGPGFLSVGGTRRPRLRGAAWRGGGVSGDGGGGLETSYEVLNDEC